MQLMDKRIAVPATNGFEQSELEVPRNKLKAAGAKVDDGVITSRNPGDLDAFSAKRPTHQA
jgi:protease I